MKWLRHLGIRSKLIVILLLISTMSIGVTAYIGYNSGRQLIQDRISAQLTSVRKLTRSGIALYFSTLEAHIKSLSEDLMVIEALEDFDAAYQALEADPPEVSEASLRSFYRDRFLPKLAQVTDSVPVLDAYVPESPVTQYLQLRYVLRQSDSANPGTNPVAESVQASPIKEPPAGQVVDAIEDKPAQTNGLSSNGKQAYDRTHDRYHPSLKRIKEDFDYYDLFLINPAGQIVYTVSKEVDYATSVVDGPYGGDESQGLEHAFSVVRQAKGTQFVHIEDFSFHKPSYDRPAAFLAAPVYSGSKFLGVIAAQLSTKNLRRIVTQDQTWATSGLGETGEVLLVGRDLTLRAVSRPFLENRDRYLEKLRSQNVSAKTLRLIEAHNSPVLLQTAESQAIKNALLGNTGVLMDKNYLSQSALIAYAPLRIGNLDWAIATEITAEEAYQPIRQFQRQVLICAVILSLLVTLLAMLFASRFTWPIRRLMADAHQVKAGDLGTDLTIRTGDEFEELSLSLTDVVRTLRERTELSQQVRLRNESLLLRFLPDGIVKRLKETDWEDERWKVAESVPSTSVILGRLSGYEEMMAQVTLEDFVGALDELVQAVDAATERYGVEKVRTFGDAYLAVCGLSTPHLDHTRRALDFAQEMRSIIRRYRLEHGGNLQISIGVATGMAIAGIIGQEKLTFDVYGPAAAQAEQLQQTAQPDEIHVSQEVYERLGDMVKFEPGHTQDAWLLVSHAASQ